VSDQKPAEENDKNALPEEPADLPETSSLTPETNKPFYAELTEPFEFVSQDLFSGLYGNAAQFAVAVHDGLLSGQKSIVGLFENSLFGGEEARKEFFTTEIFNNNGAKTLTEIKFQLLDSQQNPITGAEATLASEPQTKVSDQNGIVAFRDVAIGGHTLSFSYLGDSFRKKVAIADTLTDEGKVRMEVIRVVAEKERIALWMWTAIIILIGSVVAAVFYSRKYYDLKKQKRE